MMRTKMIKTGGFTRPICKVTDLDSAIEIAVATANEKGLSLLIKPDSQGRWQAWAKRAGARGAACQSDYEFLPTGRRAKRHDSVSAKGQIFLSQIPVGCGKHAVSILL